MAKQRMDSWIGVMHWQLPRVPSTLKAMSRYPAMIESLERQPINDSNIEDLHIQLQRLEVLKCSLSHVRRWTQYASEIKTPCLFENHREVFTNTNESHREGNDVDKEKPSIPARACPASNLTSPRVFPTQIGSTAC